MAVSSRRVVVVADDGSWSVLEPLLIASLDFNGQGGAAASLR
jgi:hypothetical protein